MEPLFEKFQQRIAHGLGPGELGMVMAGAGVGKTAFLIHIALGELQAGRHVVHIALGQTLDNVQMIYETLLSGAGETDRADRPRPGRSEALWVCAGSLRRRPGLHSFPACPKYGSPADFPPWKPFFPPMLPQLPVLSSALPPARPPARTDCPRPGPS